GNRKLRYLPHRPVVRLDVKDSSVNPELPVVERVRPFARRGPPRGDLQSLRRQRLRADALNPRLLRNPFDLPGKLLKVRAGELDSRVLWHYSSASPLDLILRCLPSIALRLCYLDITQFSLLL